VDVTIGSVDTDNYSGQSVKVPAGSFSGIRFNWYRRTKEPSAFGTLYVLTEEYLGLPGTVRDVASVVGASTSIENHEYVFAPNITLTGPRTYWFYTDTRGNFAYSFDFDPYPDGVSYVTGMANLPFRVAQASWRLTPTGYVVPPPGTTVDANFRLRGVKQ
jgi:hypothetical protein